MCVGRAPRSVEEKAPQFNEDYSHRRVNAYIAPRIAERISPCRLAENASRGVAVRTVLEDPAYRVRAGLLRSSIKAADGLNRAADLIESAFGARRRDDP
jgi:hypothetical protein